MKKITKFHVWLGLVSAVVPFLLGYNALKHENLSEGILFLSLSIIIFISSGTLRICLKIDELKDELDNGEDGAN